MQNTPHVEILKDIPREKIEFLQTAYRQQGAVEVTVAAQPDGKYMLTASWAGKETPFTTPMAGV